MARPSLVFVCKVCGGETAKWQGQCPHCEEWNTLEQRTAGRITLAAPTLPATLNVDHQPMTRMSSGPRELDRVLGGGIVPGSVTLLGGDPGIGKSTLLLQLSAHVSQTHPVLYASGEESVAQVAARAKRLELTAPHLQLLTENTLETILTQAAALKCQLLVIDSIQTVQLKALPTAVGAVTQLRECTAEIVRFAKSTATAVMLIGHVTKEGTIAGPRLLEHLVDTVLYFASDAGSRFRMVRATKNRFGAVNELGFFAMTETGLREVPNPSAIFLSRSDTQAAGSVVTVTREGGRPLLIELQALVDRMHFGAPRRIAQGLDSSRVVMLLAVMNRHAGLSLQEYDVFVNVVGGMQIADTGWDLPIMLALASSLKDTPIAAGCVSFGEVGLTGEIRPVAYGEERLKEAQKQGFKHAIIPRDNLPRRGFEDMKITAVSRVTEALAAAFAHAPS